MLLPQRISKWCGTSKTELKNDSLCIKARGYPPWFPQCITKPQINPLVDHTHVTTKEYLKQTNTLGTELRTQVPVMND